MASSLGVDGLSLERIVDSTPLPLWGGKETLLHCAINLASSLMEYVGTKCWFVTILRIIFRYCHSIERICIDTSGHFIRTASLLNFGLFDQPADLIKNYPLRLLSSLALRGCGISNDLLSVLVKGACGLKCLGLSRSSSFSGIFLRDLGYGGSANSLETLILRDCMHLRADISSENGLVSRHVPGGPRTRCAMEVSQVLRVRPDIHLIAVYPHLRCFDGDCTNLPSPSSNIDSGSSSAEYE